MVVLIICFLANIVISNGEVYCSSGAKVTRDRTEKLSSPGNVCDEPILRGPARYAYNRENQHCEAFVPGCATNGNNFVTLESCKSQCSGSKEPVKLLVGGPPKTLGIKWCGKGDTADNYDDLGYSKETDACCREHDFCPDLILAGETKYNLTNDASYTRLSCECDEKFRQCLQRVNSKLSSQIGTIYFNALGTKCYRKEYPIKRCKSKGGWLYRKCLKYELDHNSKKIYQWFSVPNYDDKEKNKLKLDWGILTSTRNPIRDAYFRTRRPGFGWRG